MTYFRVLLVVLQLVATLNAQANLQPQDVEVIKVAFARSQLNSQAIDLDELERVQNFPTAPSKLDIDFDEIHQFENVEAEEKLFRDIPHFDIKDIKLDDIKPYEPYRRHYKKIDWTVFGYSVLAFILAGVFILAVALFIKAMVNRQNGPTGSLNISRVTILVARRANPEAQVNAFQDANQDKDLPPSYDQAVVNVPQNVPLL